MPRSTQSFQGELPLLYKDRVRDTSFTQGDGQRRTENLVKETENLKVTEKTVKGIDNLVKMTENLVPVTVKNGTLSPTPPKVLWGENAPALYQGAEELVQKLVSIGAENGYTFSMVKTDSQQHGLPQV